MTQGKHTPGPWVRDCWDILGNAKGNGGGTGHVCEVSRPNEGDEKYWEDGEADANARLIAAAPDMLEALQAVVSAYENGGMIEPIFMARAAIARATGEKP